jgi:hypothetical protein
LLVIEGWVWLEWGWLQWKSELGLLVGWLVG